MENERAASILEKDIALKVLCVKSIRAASSASIEHLCKDIVTFFEKYRSHYKDNWIDFEKEYKFLLKADYVQKGNPLILKEFEYIMGKARKQPQQELKDILPEHLKTDEAVKTFQRAIDAKMIEKTTTGLKWHKSKALLAYFLGHWLKDGVFPETEYDKLFGESRLGKAYSQLMNNRCGNGKPRGYEEIDKLFKEQS